MNNHAALIMINFVLYNINNMQNKHFLCAKAAGKLIIIFSLIIICKMGKCLEFIFWIYVSVYDKDSASIIIKFFSEDKEH